jgi:hypothetical protein
VEVIWSSNLLEFYSVQNPFHLYSLGAFQKTLFKSQLQLVCVH